MADPREAVVRKYRAKMIEHKTMEAQVKKGAFGVFWKYLHLLLRSIASAPPEFGLFQTHNISLQDTLSPTMSRHCDVYLLCYHCISILVPPFHTAQPATT